MKNSKRGVTRRRFMQGTAAGVAAFSIVPRNVLGMGEAPPSEEFGGALIGCGGRGRGTFKGLGDGVRMLAQCDVRFKGKADDKMIYTDYRRVLERKDIDVVAIATHHGWHALVSIAAMEAGKDVLCEKPLALTYEQGVELVRLAEHQRRILMIGHVLEYHPGVMRLLELVRGGELGKVRREENICGVLLPTTSPLFCA